MQERDSNSNTHPGDSLAVDLMGEGNSGIEDNNAPVNTSQSQSLHGNMNQVEATSTAVQQSDTMIGERPGNDDDHEASDHEASENIALATSLLNEVLETISQPNLESVLYIFRQVLEEATPGHALHSGTLRSLVLTLGLKYICTKDQETLSELIHLGDHFKEINSATPDLNIVVEDDGLQDMFKLGKAAWDEVLNLTSPTTLNTIIFLLQQSLSEISSEDENWSTALATLACAMYLQFHHSKSTSGLTSLFATLQGAESDGQNCQIANILKLIELAISASGEHGKHPTKDDGLLRERSIFEQGARISSGPTADNGSLLQYGLSLLESFQTNGNMDDLQNGIEMLRLGLTKTSFNNPNYNTGLGNLAVGLQFRFENHGNFNDLDESISLCRQALDLQPSPHPGRSTSLNNLATGLSTRFKQQGNPQDLDESISLHRQGLDLWPSLHPFRSESLNNLATALHIRFDQWANPQDLDESISLCRQALDLQPSPHPGRSTSLNNLANGLFIRFDNSCHQSDQSSLAFP